MVKRFTKNEKIAIEVLMRTRLIKHWATGEAKAYSIEPSSPGYVELIERLSRQLAERTISQQVP